MNQRILIRAIAVLSAGGVIARPFGLSEAIWAVFGAVRLIALAALVLAG